MRCFRLKVICWRPSSNRTPTRRNTPTGSAAASAHSNPGKIRSLRNHIFAHSCIRGSPNSCIRGKSNSCSRGSPNSCIRGKSNSRSRGSPNSCIRGQQISIVYFSQYDVDCLLIEDIQRHAFLLFLAPCARKHCCLC
jgi:hypothetical protein